MNRLICLTALLLPAFTVGLEAQLREFSITCSPWSVGSALCEPYNSPQLRNLGRVAAPRDSAPASVLAAERQGQLFPRPSGIPHRPTLPDSVKLVGTDERKCISADIEGVVESGEMIANFSKYAEVWRMGFGKMWWRPTRSLPADVAETLVVRATRLDKNAPPHVFEHHVQALPAHTYPPAIITGFILPTTGKWLLVASVGANWGCFVYTLR